MSRENIPLAHLKCLLDNNEDLSPEDRADILAGLKTSDPEVDRRFEGLFPGVLSYLAEIYRFKGQRAVLMWTLPCFEGRTIDDVMGKRRIRNRVVRLPKPGGDVAASVRTYYADSETIEAEVWINKTSFSDYEGEPWKNQWTNRVDARVLFSRKKLPIIEIDASVQDARKTLYTLLDWLGERVPKKSEERAKVFAPVNFTEKQVVEIATNLGWGSPSAVSGPDPTGEVGEMMLQGKGESADPAPLDTNAGKVAMQLKSTTKNAARRYRVETEHDDGYNEPSQVSFHFLVGHSRLQFHHRASRIAMNNLISRLRTKLDI